MRISGWISDVCSSDLERVGNVARIARIDNAVAADADHRGVDVGEHHLTFPAQQRRKHQGNVDSAARKIEPLMARTECAQQVGRASCRASEWQYGEARVVVVELKKKNAG